MPILTAPTSLIYTAIHQRQSFPPKDPITIPPIITPSRETFTIINTSTLRNKLKEFFYLLSTNSLPVHINTPCPLCNKPLTKSHILQCSQIPPPTSTDPPEVAHHYWAHWKSLNNILHDNPPPLSSKHLLQNPSDLELVTITSLWPKDSQPWWYGTIENYNETTDEFHVCYDTPYESSAYVPLSSSTWHIPYTPEEISSYNTTHNITFPIILSEEKQRQTNTIKKPKNSLDNANNDRSTVPS